jgi:hypothetical protein
MEILFGDEPPEEILVPQSDQTFNIDSKNEIQMKVYQPCPMEVPDILPPKPRRFPMRKTQTI